VHKDRIEEEEELLAMLTATIATQATIVIQDQMTV
jgi:hypothetical protein